MDPVNIFPLLGLGGVGLGDIVIGLSLGSRLFLIAVGLSLIFGVLGVLNFAHGALYMLGAYFALSFSTNVIGNFWLALVVGAIAVGVVGAAIEVVTIRPLYERAESDLDQLIVTFGFVLITHEVVRFVWGSQPYSTDAPGLLDFSVSIGGSQFTAYRLFVIVAAAAVMVGLWLFIKRTYFGSLVRGTSSDREMASMLGVDVPRLYTAVFFTGSLLAGLGGALAAPMQSIGPSLGEAVIIDAFIIVVIGGLGSLSGAFVGAMFVGMMQSIVPQFFDAGSIAVPFLAMVIVLLIKPEGLFGGIGE
ncbi:branched-chain amino acid ABC transporter permease [Natrinema zhouii]|uniref:Branched-chain amino acid ABC transporter permease n=1 Tax=Natrinema zhouii TaxID=1710539 RepID=A0A7D6CQE9_9EURY|nr:branched-chain amino acid ABC transporter permease [Natrinema zhouii]QLK25451.1 branched-chain amino acid ABC transporter permease [Natrinema zhouii]